jgi:hypothetical protein
MYLRDNNNPQGKGNPIGCLAIGINDVPNGTSTGKIICANIFYQLSICHPNDKFDRQFGQSRAMGKLQGLPIYAGNIQEKEISIHQITSMVMSHVSKNKDFPVRIRQSAQRWLSGAMLKAVAVL